MLRPDTLALTALLAMLTAIGPLSTDMYLPSLPSIGAELSASTSEVQLTLSIFLAGYAVGQIFYGPISDRKGRRPILLAALVTFIIGSFLCAVAWSIESLIVGRFIQAIGGSGPIVLARSVVRDLYEGPRAGQELSRMGSIMGLVPAVAPAFGGFLQTLFDWSASFWTTCLFGAALMVAVYIALPETCPASKQKDRAPLRFGSFLMSFAPMLRHGGFLAYMGIVLGTFGGLFAFISGSSFVLQGVYGQSEILFGLSFGMCALSFVLGTIIASKLIMSKGINFVMKLGIGAMISGAGLMIMGQLIDSGLAAELVAPMMLYMVGVGLALPQSMAQAVMPFPKAAGAASSLIGFTQMTFAAVVGIVVGHQINGSAWPLALIIAGCALLSLGVYSLRPKA